MSLTIPDEVFKSAHMTEEELRCELAVMLFQKEKLTLGQASQLAGLTQLEFQQALASRKIPLHYDVAEFDEDMKTLAELGRL